MGTVPTSPPTAKPAKTRPARNMFMLIAAVCTVVPIVTMIHIICMNLMRPSLSPKTVWVRAPPASPAIYTATTAPVRALDGLSM